MTATTKALRFNDRNQWRAWLEEHHAASRTALLVIHKSRYRHLGLTLDEAVEEALCYGWIDGTLRSLDERCFLLRFTPRRRNSPWSIRNIRRVERLRRQGRVAAAGLRAVAEGRAGGAWEAALRSEEPDRVPEELLRALRRRKGAISGYRGLTRSRRKQLIHWLLTAKRDATRASRIAAIVAEALGSSPPPNGR